MPDEETIPEETIPEEEDNIKEPDEENEELSI